MIENLKNPTTIEELAQVIKEIKAFLIEEIEKNKFHYTPHRLNFSYVKKVLDFIQQMEPVYKIISLKELCSGGDKFRDLLLSSNEWTEFNQKNILIEVKNERSI